MSADLFGFEPPRAKFTDIRNQRESIAEEKARLCMELNELCRTPPRSLGAASIQAIHAWRVEHKAALKTLCAKDASRQQLRAAINSMRRFK